MAGYTRQAANNIVTGGIIDAADFNAEYNAIEAAFNASTGHIHDGTIGNGPPIENLGPAQDLVVTSSVVRPKVNNTYDLGTSSIQWKDGYFDGRVTTDLLLVDETSEFTGNVTATADVSIGGNLTVTGNATISGNLTFGDADTDSINLSAEIDSHIIPNTDGTYNLGSATKEWNDLFIDGTANIDSLVADTADINGGSIDSTTIGANSAAAITGTLITASTNFAGDLTGDVTGNLTGNVTGDIKATNGTTVFDSGTDGSNASLTGNASTATRLQTARNIGLSGDLSGSANFDGSSNITINATIQGNSVALGTDTTGNYASSVAAGGGITVTGTAGEGTAFTVAHSDTSSQVSSNNTGRTYIQDITLDTYGHVTGIATATETVVNTDTNTNQLTTFVVEDGDGTEVTISHNKEWKFVEGYGIDINWTDTSNGSDTDPYDLQFSLQNDHRIAGNTDVYNGNTNDYTFYDASIGIRWYTAGGEDMRLTDAGVLHVDNDIIAYSTTIPSDERLKENIEPITGALDKINKLNGYTFTYKKDGKQSAGVIAQEVEKVLPSAVTDQEDVFSEEGETYKSVQYDQLHGLLIEAIKELKAEIEELKNGSSN